MMQRLALSAGICLFIAHFAACASTSVSSSPSFTPTAIALGPSPTISTSPAPKTFTLKYRGSNVATLDYGTEVTGYPYFVVNSLTKPAQIELKFTEQFPGLESPFGDGPYYFANGLSNTFRVETFNVTVPGRYESTLIQGGQRWEAMTLLTNGRVTIGEVGLIPTVDVVDLDDTPSSFSCSNSLYNQIWDLGARAVTAACFDAESQGSTWQTTQDGAYILGQRPATSAYGVGFSSSNFKLTFRTKIAKSGTGWAYNYGAAAEGYVFVLTSSLPTPSTFVNTNKTITPANTLTLTYGWGPVNQTSLETYHLDNFAVPFTIQENTWYTISTQLTSSNYLYVIIDNHTIFNVSTSRYSWVPNAGIFAGTSFGFGGYQDTAAYFTNVSACAENGTQIYSNALTDAPTVLPEYGVAPNSASVCLDGAKRDRLVWLGDFFHTSRIIPASTARWDFVTGTLDYLAAWQNPLGLLSIAPPLGYPPSLKEALGDFSFLYFGLEDYQLLGLSALYAYYERTGDLNGVKQLWPAYKKLLTYLLDTVDPSTNLVNIGGFLGPAYGSATSGLFVQALHGCATIARDLNDTTSVASYTSVAKNITNGINTHLWNSKLGIYALSNSSMNDYSVAGLSFAVTSGAAPASRARKALAALSNLQLYPGYKDSTQTDDAGAVLSPNTNGFLLSAAMQANVTAPVKYMLDNLWGAAMVSNPRYSSGASWEYVGQDLTPGLSLFTSLSHPWGGAPTYVLTEYVAGLRPIEPGYRVFAVVPAVYGFDLSYAQASVKTVYGILSVKWTLSKKGVLTVKIKAPAGTTGSVQLPGGKAMGNVVVDSVVGGGGQEEVEGAEVVEVGSGESTVVIQV